MDTDAFVCSRVNRACRSSWSRDEYGNQVHDGHLGQHYAGDAQFFRPHGNGPYNPVIRDGNDSCRVLHRRRRRTAHPRVQQNAITNRAAAGRPRFHLRHAFQSVLTVLSQLVQLHHTLPSPSLSIPSAVLLQLGFRFSGLISVRTLLRTRSQNRLSRHPRIRFQIPRLQASCSCCTGGHTGTALKLRVLLQGRSVSFLSNDPVRTAMIIDWRRSSWPFPRRLPWRFARPGPGRGRRSRLPAPAAPSLRSRPPWTCSCNS